MQYILLLLYLNLILKKKDINHVNWNKIELNNKIYIKSKNSPHSVYET